MIRERVLLDDGALAVIARRLAVALAGGHADALAGAELVLAILEAVRGSRAPEATHSSDVAVARRVGLSGWELARRFRRVTGTSIHRYRTALRVQAALERIEAGERDLTGLALDLGFFDQRGAAVPWR